MIKGGAGFASTDNPQVCVVSPSMVCSQYYIMLSSSVYEERCVCSCMVTGPFSTQWVLICAVPAGCQIQSWLLPWPFNPDRLRNFSYQSPIDDIYNILNINSQILVNTRPLITWGERNSWAWQTAQDIVMNQWKLSVIRSCRHACWPYLCMVCCAGVVRVKQ